MAKPKGLTKRVATSPKKMKKQTRCNFEAGASPAGPKKNMGIGAGVNDSLGCMVQNTNQQLQALKHACLDLPQWAYNLPQCFSSLLLGMVGMLFAFEGFCFVLQLQRHFFLPFVLALILFAGHDLAAQA